MRLDLIARAQEGDEEAFRQLVEPHRRELQVHCYRILGSVQDAEDAVQETLLTAWRSLGGFERRASVRTWLYRVATSRCLNALRASSRRPRTDWPPPDLHVPEPTRVGEVIWLEPYPDAFLPNSADTPAGPEARYEATEAISLAFVTALQSLPPRQRTALVLRDVLGFPASEAAQIMGSTEVSVSSAVKRARATLQRRVPASGNQEPPPLPNSPVEQEVLARLTRAYEIGDIDSVVALLTDDVWVSMPPVPLEYQGSELAARFHRSVTFRDGRTYQLVPTRANGQPAYCGYFRDPASGLLRATGLVVLTLAGDRISAMTRFDNSVLSSFGLLRTLPG